MGARRQARARRRARAHPRLAARRRTAPITGSRPSVTASCTAAPTTPPRCAWTPRSSRSSRSSCRSRRCTSRTTWRRSASCSSAAPELPQVACFDTAFHRTKPPLAQMFALPQELTDAGVRRYGFHGLSYEYIASALPRLDDARRARRDRRAASRQRRQHVRAAMRAAASPARWASPRSTACRWAPAAARIDPGVILYLMDERGMDARAIEKLIYTQSGLLGVSGVSSDMRALLESSEPRAKLAVDLFVYRIGRELGSLAAALGGLDAHRLHRRHRRARGADPRAGLPRRRPGSASSSTPQPTRARPAHQHARRAAPRPG